MQVRFARLAPSVLLAGMLVTDAFGGDPVCPSEGGCCIPHDTPGCNNVECCNIMCRYDPFCCRVIWDGQCANEATHVCDLDDACDCNENGVYDLEDILSGTSTDCNDNLIPDECEDCAELCLDCPSECGEDCNGNGIPDACLAYELDCNTNGTPDECDVADGTSPDCNGNGVPDECDLMYGTSPDCNGNGVPDECDVVNGNSPDCNGNGNPDECDLICHVDIVFVMDTSGSMTDEAAALCAAIELMPSALADLGIDARTTVLGITDSPGGDFACLVDDVESLLGSRVPGNGACGALNHKESWGPATAVVADRFQWLPDATRVIVPLSDEGPCRGEPCEDPGDDRDAIENAILVANANGVRVFPITGTGSDTCTIGLATELAQATGGVTLPSSELTAQLPGAILDVESRTCLFFIDCDDDDQIDSCQIAADPGLDQNGNGILDLCECLVVSCPDPEPLVVGGLCADASCPDLDGSGRVDVPDLVFVILSWGDPGCKGQVPCCADLDGSGAVDVVDLVCVVLKWACEYPAPETCTAPLPDLTGDVTIVQECQGDVTVWQSPPPGTTLPWGESQVTLMAADAGGNEAVCTATVTVEDHMAPTIGCPEDIVVQSSVPVVVEFIADALDLCDPAPLIVCDPPSGSVFQGITEVVCTATDQDGNTSTCAFTVTVEAPGG